MSTHTPTSLPTSVQPWGRRADVTAKERQAELEALGAHSSESLGLSSHHFSHTTLLDRSAQKCSVGFFPFNPTQRGDCDDEDICCRWDRVPLARGSGRLPARKKVTR